MNDDDTARDERSRRLIAIARAIPAPTYLIRVRNYVVKFSIGVYPHERLARQRVRINIELEVARPSDGFGDDLARVPSYEDLILAIKAMADGPHVGLVETLADRIGDLCLAHAAVRRASVTVEKLDVFAEAESVGVTVERRRDA